MIVAGAGLSGLTAAVDLAAAGHEVRVVEARARVGGRLMTAAPVAGGRFDLGATWHWDGQPHVRALAERFGIAPFPQPGSGAVLYEQRGVPPRPVAAPMAPAWRFAGGAQQLCDRLAECLGAGRVLLEHRVVSVAAGTSGIDVGLAGPDGPVGTATVDAAVLALPPRLALQDVAFTPELPAGHLAAMAATPTWMGEALKCVAVYDTAFWRRAGLSGSAFSEVGPLAEVHDASEPDGPPALWGFVALDPDWRDLAPAERVPAVLEQLARLFGPEGADPVSYFERDWSADPNTCEDEHSHGPFVAFGHAALRSPLWNGRLVWAGTETADRGGGHMEGAVVAGRRAARQVLGGA